MISSLLFAVLAVAPVNIVELPDSEADVIVCQAVGELPQLGAKELAYARLIAEVMPLSTEDYSSNTLIRYGTLAGYPVRCTLMTDHIRVQVVVPKGQLPLGISLMDSLVRRSSLSEEDISRVAKSQPFRTRSYWADALIPDQPDYTRMRLEDIKELYARVFSPMTTTFAIGGAFESGEARALLNQRYADWAEPTLRSYRPSPAPKPRATHRVPIATVDFQGPSIKGDDPNLAKKILTLITLGSGKGSTLFRTWRETLGATYRQEAILWPEVGGFRPRLLAAVSGKSEGLDSQKLKAAILADVETWNYETLARSLGMAEGILLRDIELNPFYFAGVYPLRQNIVDRTFMAGYWQMKTGKPFSANAMLNAFRATTVEELQQFAKEMVSVSYVTVMPGK